MLDHLIDGAARIARKGRKHPEIVIVGQFIPLAQELLRARRRRVGCVVLALGSDALRCAFSVIGQRINEEAGVVLKPFPPAREAGRDRRIIGRLLAGILLERALHRRIAALRQCVKRVLVGCFTTLRDGHSARHSCRTDHLGNVIRVFRVAARLQRARKRFSITARTQCAAVTALDQAGVVITKGVQRVISSIGVTAAGHVVGRHRAAPGKVLDVAKVVRARNDTFSPAGLQAPLANEDRRIDVQALAHRLRERRHTVNKALYVGRCCALRFAIDKVQGFLGKQAHVVVILTWSCCRP